MSATSSPIEQFSIPAMGGSGGGGQLSTFRSAAEYSKTLDACRANGMTVGFVPTMGALHAGHRALIERAVAECDVVAVSVFVNPIQFDDAGDLEEYPRTPAQDGELIAAAGARYQFHPEVDDMYPDGFPVLTTVSVSGLADRWEAVSRPGHFTGVATVVAKLFAMTGRCRAYFGEKDFQQLAVVRRMAADLSFPVEVVGCPTVREEDGLALSSRNVRLGDEDREIASAFPKALAEGVQAVADGETRPTAVEALVMEKLREHSDIKVDYVAVVDAADLTPAITFSEERPTRLLAAVEINGVRLIDNVDPMAGDPGLPSTRSSIRYAGIPINPDQGVVYRT